MPSWTEYEWLQKPRRGAEYVAARAPLVNRFYWKYAPTYYRWAISRQVDCSAPLDPLKIVWVDPDEISLFSGRKDLTKNRWQDVGRILSGEWDKRQPQKISKKGRKNAINVSYADSIENTQMYDSFRMRYVNGIDWTETQLFKKLYRDIENGHAVWRSCRSKKDLINRCDTIDELYHSIKNDGYKSQLELLDINNLSHLGYLDLLCNEVSVDIARDGSLLFVDGRHRLCLSKILNLKKIPVMILVRHSIWVNKRDEIYQNNTKQKNIQHPDLKEIH